MAGLADPGRCAGGGPKTATGEGLMGELIETESAGRRTLERLAVVGILLLMLAAVAMPQVFRRVVAKSASSVPVDEGAKNPISTAGEFRGVALQLHNYDESVPFEEYVQEIADTGANTICLSLAGYQENCSSSCIFIEQRKTPTPDRLERIIGLARQKGMHVILMPIILLQNPGAGEWRGKIDPKQQTTWWESYENFMLFYAKIAEKTKVDVLAVGSELVSMEKHTDQWKQLIRKVRSTFNGKLTYSANWDHYENIEWWNDLDIVGMTSYYDVSSGKDKPSLEDIVAAWKPIKENVLNWQKGIHRPLFFTEVGYPNQHGCAKDPWNYYGSSDPEPETQALCYEAFLKSWGGCPAMAGFCIWEWRKLPGEKVGPEDISYNPCGKPALKVLKDYFASPGAMLPTSMPTTTTAPARAASEPATVPPQSDNPPPTPQE
jgi:hypothetical protein